MPQGFSELNCAMIAFIAVSLSFECWYQKVIVAPVGSTPARDCAKSDKPTASDW